MVVQAVGALLKGRCECCTYFLPAYLHLPHLDLLTIFIKDWILIVFFAPCTEPRHHLFIQVKLSHFKFFQCATSLYVFLTCYRASSHHHHILGWWFPPKPARTSQFIPPRLRFFFSSLIETNQMGRRCKKVTVQTSLPLGDLFLYLPYVWLLSNIILHFLLWTLPLFSFFFVTSCSRPCPGSSLIIACSTHTEGLLSLSLSSLSLLPPRQ